MAGEPIHRVYRIHPGIGIARIGNSCAEGEAGYFVGPEVPDINFAPPGGKYRDANNDIKRQGVRFRIYEYTYDVVGPPLLLKLREDSVREITSDQAEIEWHVHIVNRKSRDVDLHPVHNDPGVKTIGGKKKSIDVGGSVLGAKVQLGTLKTDEKGRLILLGGFGKSDSPQHLPLINLYSRGWYDDVSDGYVRATITMKGAGSKKGAGAKPGVEPAWAIVGVPRFAEPITAIVTMYDLAYDVATKLAAPNTLVPPPTVSFSRDIYPVLFRAVMMQWVNPESRIGHGSGAGGNFLDPPLFDLLKSNDQAPGSQAFSARNHVFGKLKPNPGADMPPLNADLRLTDLQFDRFKKWASGDFIADWTGPPVPPPPVTPFEKLSASEQTQALDMTGLWTAVGGSFAPGIEASIIMSQTSTYGQPFRINQTLAPGTLTEGLAIPWQADYRACGWNWWPSGRPEEVTQDGTNFYDWIPAAMTQEQLVIDWPKLGFLFKKAVAGAEIYVEQERLI